MYAHRNEDIVNTRTNERNNCATDECAQSLSEGLQSKKEIKHMDKAKSYSVEQKRKEFSRVASCMGMNDLAFSRWLLSVSPLQRHEVLENYRKKKKRKYHFK